MVVPEDGPAEVQDKGVGRKGGMKRRSSSWVGGYCMS
jgi:hypothetical protein